MARYLAMWAASYYHALRPRLLVPVTLAASMAAFNALNAEGPLSGYQELALLLGFLSHKVALLVKAAAELSPKVRLDLAADIISYTPHYVSG